MKFSVLCLTYKRPEFLSEAVFSVLNQTMEEFEMIIVNDCLEQTLKINHPKVRIFNLPKRMPTIGEKRNFAMQWAEGEFITWIDDDDLMLPNHLKTMLSMIGDGDWLTAQRYFDFDGSNLVLMPNPIASVFAFRHRPELYYEKKNFDEILPFYRMVRSRGKGICAISNNPGYVYCHRGDYSMFEMGSMSVSEQNRALEQIPFKKGVIQIVPSKPKYQFML